jgi:ubiquitin C-terminal hydrolase
MIVRTFSPKRSTRLIVEHLSIAGDVIAPTRPDLPRGLNQLGNTCYLNSLLQVVTGVSPATLVNAVLILPSTSIPLRTSGRL